MTRKTKKRKCPKCESKEVVPIIYGMPSEELLEEMGKGEVALGGCCIIEGQPEWYCKTCDHEFKMKFEGFKNELKILKLLFSESVVEDKYKHLKRVFEESESHWNDNLSYIKKNNIKIKYLLIAEAPPGKKIENPKYRNSNRQKKGDKWIRLELSWQIRCVEDHDITDGRIKNG